MSSGSACWILWLTPMDWLALSIGRSGSQPLEYSEGTCMIMKNIKIIEGEIKCVNNIEAEEGKWVFNNHDPQIIIKFDRPVKGIRLRINLNSTSNLAYNTSIYFNYANLGFTEDKVIKYERRFTFLSNMTDILFDDYYTDIRIDPDDNNSSMFVNSFYIEPLYKNPNGRDEFYKILNPSRSKNSYVLFTHELSNTGAPILALNIARWLIKNANDLIVVACNSADSVLTETYKNDEIPLYYFDDFTTSKYVYINSSTQSSTNYCNQIFFFRSIKRFRISKCDC